MWQYLNNTFYSFILGFLALPTLCFAGIDITETCDLGGNIIAHSQEKDATNCAQKCEILANCQGFTFISGWNRCNLKDKIGRKVIVRMFSGEISSGSDGKRMIGKEGYDFDYTGKDWQGLQAKTHEACRDLCLKQTPCLGFTMIEGYDKCWLKKTVGKLISKRFFCGIKKTP